MSFLFGNPNGSGAQQSSQQLDPDIKKAYLGNLDRANSTANSLRGLRGTPDFYAGQDFLRGTITGQAGINTIDQAAQTAGNLQSYKPMMLKGEQAGFRTYDALQGTAAQTGADDINRFMNPYQQQVIDATMADQARARALAGQQDNAQAIGQKAFGGSRADLTKTVRDVERERADTANLAALRSQGFNTALGAAQSDVANRQQMGLANLGYGNEAARYGADAFNTNQQFNANMRQQANLANQQADLQGATLRGTAARLGGDLGASQFDKRLTAGSTLRDLGMSDMNLALQEQAVRNQALGLNPGGGSGVQSSNRTQGKGLFDYIF